MKKSLNKIQQKIYAIFQTLKAYASKLRISSFVGGQFKERQKRNEIKDNTHFTKTYIHAKYNIRDGLNN
jgi:hypothetical protein